MYYLTTYFNKLRDVTYEVRDVGDGLEECIVIPMRRNGFIKTPKGSVILKLIMSDKRPNAYKQTHYISVYTPPEIREEIQELGFADRFRFFGQAKMGYLDKKNPDLFAGARLTVDEALEIE